jgi:WD40 repeat protein
MTVETAPNLPFYYASGTLPTGAPSYVVRQADTDLFTALDQGELSYVLNTRQIGKSSLMVRTVRRLREAGHTVAVLDLTAIGQNLSPEQWYDGLLLALGEQLNLDDALEDFWDDHRTLGPMQRFFEAILRVALPRCPQRLVIFVDEVDAVRSLPFSADEFFAGIRECYNRRVSDPLLARLTFCLLGVATPADLISDTRLSPFNVGRRIVLTDFVPAEAAALARGLGTSGPALIERALHWTGGHPYLTQRLCMALLHRAARTERDVDAACADLFLSRTARETDDNLSFVRNRLLRSEGDLAALLELYRRVRIGKRVPDDETNPLCGILRLSGVVRTENGRLQVRNRIYAHVFDVPWVLAHLPDTELQRQKAAYRRGLVRAAALSGIVFTPVIALTIWALRSAQIAEAAASVAQVAQKAEATSRSEAERNATRAARAAMEASSQAHRANQREQEARRARQRETAARRQVESSLALARRREQEALVARAAAVHNALEAREQARRADAETVNARRQEQVARTATGKERTARLQGEAYFYAANINLVQREWDAGNVENVRTLLDQVATTTVHSFEWDYWNRLCPLVARLRAHPQEVHAVAFSPDGSTFVTSGNEGTIRRWDTATRRLLGTMTGHTGEVWDMAFAPNGCWMVSGSHDGTARVWDARTGALRRTFQVEKERVWSVAVTPDNQGVILGTDQGARCLALTGNQTRWTFPAGGIALCTSGNGHLTVRAGWDGRIYVIETATGRMIQEIPSVDPRPIHGLRLSHDAHTLAIGVGEDQKSGGIVVLDIASEKVLHRLQTPLRPVNSLAFTPDDRRLVATDWHNDLHVFDLASGNEEQVRRDAGRPVTLSPDGRHALTGNWTGTVRLWRLQSASPVILDHGADVRCAAFSPDGRMIASGGRDKILRVWNAVSGQSIWATMPTKRGVDSLAFSPDGSQLACGTGDGTVRIFAAQSGHPLITCPSNGAEVDGLAFSPDGTRLALVSRNQVARIVDVRTGEIKTTLAPVTGIPVTVAFARDGRTVAVGGSKAVSLYDASTGKERSRLFVSKRWVRAIAYSPDGKTLATADEEGAARLWNAADGRSMRTIDDYNELYAVSFLPDGRRLVTAGKDGALHLWDLFTGREVMRLNGRQGAINAVAVSPDGKRILTAGDDGTIRIWES